jgi:hypothetical protein
MKDRRNLLKGLAVGSVWATPVVSSVMLPAHAATTGCSVCFTIDVTMTGDYNGGHDYYLYSITDGCRLIEEFDSGWLVTGNISEVYCFNLEPGKEYSFAGSGGGDGTDGSADALATLSCCGSDSELVVADIGAGGDNGDADLVAIITIGSDGSCSIEEIDCCAPCNPGL